MVSTITLPVRNGSPVQVRYPLRDPATYAFPHLMFILRLMIPKSIILLALWTACTAFGNTIIVTGIDSAMGIQSISMDENGSATPIYWSGAIDINVNGYIRQVFCVQLFTDIYLNTTYDTVMDYSDTANLKRVGWLLQNEFPTAALYTGAALQTAGAAFQLAIWDIIEDNGDGFAPGAGKLTQSTDASTPTTERQHPHRPCRLSRRNTIRNAQRGPEQRLWHRLPQLLERDTHAEPDGGARHRWRTVLHSRTGNRYADLRWPGDDRGGPSAPPPPR